MIHKSIEIDTKLKGKEYKIKLDFRSNKAVIIGDSGSGKSIVYQLIEREVTLGNVDVVLYNYNSVETLKRDLESGKFKFSNKLVVFDNADILIRNVPEVLGEINMNYSNVYLIFARVAKGVDASPNVCGEMEYKDGIFSIKYRYPEGMWS